MEQANTNQKFSCHVCHRISPIMYFNGHLFLLNFGDKLVTVFLKKIKKKCLVVRCVGGGRAAWRMGATRPIWECHVACGRPARPVSHAAAAVCCGGASGAADGGASLQLPRRWRGCGSPWWQRGQQGVAAVSSVRWAVAGSGVGGVVVRPRVHKPI